MLWVPNFQHVVTVHQGQSCGEAKKLVDLSPSLFNLLWRKMGEGQRGGEVVMFPRFEAHQSCEFLHKAYGRKFLAFSVHAVAAFWRWQTHDQLWWWWGTEEGEVVMFHDQLWWWWWWWGVSWQGICISCRSICDQNQNGIKETFLRVGQKIKVTSRWNKSRNQYIVRSHGYGFMHSQTLPTITSSGEKLCLIAWLLPFKALDYWCWE